MHQRLASLWRKDNRFKEDPDRYELITLFISKVNFIKKGTTIPFLLSAGHTVSKFVFWE